MINLKIFGDVSFEGEYKFDDHTTLKEIYKEIGGIKRPKLIQVGGALGKLLVDDGINVSLDEVKEDLIENSLSYFNQNFCPVDFMRFMLRFTIRELNIINDTLKEINRIVDNITSGNIDLESYEIFLILINRKPTKKAEELLFNNLKFISRYFKDEILEHVINKNCQNSICRGLFEAQCINACPAHINIPGFVALMKESRVEDAYKLMRKDNPLSSICGSVCARPCEFRCRRGEITSTVGVRALQRFISSTALKEWSEEKIEKINGKRVAIIGAGPSGLTAAYYLIKSGYEVTIYEANAYAGGMLAFGVPSYRLPLASINEEVESIKSLGVKIVTNTKVGLDITLKDLKDKYDAVIIATGASKGKIMNYEHDNLISGIDFLRSIRLDDNKNIGSKVIVVGGGDVALDCARTSIRLGADVSVISLENFHLLPASEEEIKFSLEEGVNFISGYGIKTVNNKEVILKKCIQVLDDFGMFSPIFSEEVISLQDVDTIILAIGQTPELDYLDKECINDNGFLKLESQFKIRKNIFACGDVIKPTVVIDAITQGKKTAIEVDKFLNGNGIYFGDPIQIPNKILNIRTFDYDIKEEEVVSLKKRISSFDEAVKVYTYEDAIYEADRCMRCDRNSRASLLLGK